MGRVVDDKYLVREGVTRPYQTRHQRLQAYAQQISRVVADNDDREITLHAHVPLTRVNN